MLTHQRQTDPRRLARLCDTRPSRVVESARSGSAAGPARSPAKTAPTGRGWCERWPCPTTGVGSPTPRWARASSKVTSTGQRMTTTHCRISTGVASDRYRKRLLSQFTLGVTHQPIADLDRAGVECTTRPYPRRPTVGSVGPLPVHLDGCQCVSERPPPLPAALSFPLQFRARLAPLGARRVIQRGIQPEADEPMGSWLPPAPAARLTAKPPSTTTTRSRPGSQRCTCRIISLPPSTLGLCRRPCPGGVRPAQGGQKRQRPYPPTQCAGTNSIIDPHFKPKQWMTCFLMERTASDSALGGYLAAAAAFHRVVTPRTWSVAPGGTRQVTRSPVNRPPWRADHVARFKTRW